MVVAGSGGIQSGAPAKGQILDHHHDQQSGQAGKTKGNAAGVGRPRHQ